MPNLGGSSQRKRRLLATVVNSQLLYGSPVWANALVYNRNVEIILRRQRTIAHKTAMTYRMVSTQAIMVINGQIPEHLLAWERRLRYERRQEPNSKDKDVQKEIFRKWQSEWYSADTVRWTWRLIRDVRMWVLWANQSHGSVATDASGNTYIGSKSSMSRSVSTAENQWTTQNTLFSGATGGGD